MIIAFLGKGGSGKSSLATAFVRHSLSQGKTVLAIDADHNMDMTYSLGIDSPSLFLGADNRRIKRHIGVPDSISFLDAARIARETGIRFTINPADVFTASMAVQVNDCLSVMTAGPHTDIVRSGEHCSHSLAAPLKAYLPNLVLARNQICVVDERAGTDPVATGILSGVHRACIVVEPTIQSVRVARQIAHELDIAGIPYEFVANKYRAEDELFLQLSRPPICYIPFTDDAHHIEGRMTQLAL